MNNKANTFSKPIVDETNNENVMRIIGEGLKAYNESKIGAYKRDNFVIYIKSADEKIIAGLCGDILGKVCAITQMWVIEEYRRKGIGTNLLEKLEAYAKNKCCTIIQLDTAEFQARDFYEKSGFVEVAKLEAYFMGYDLYIMRKYLQKI